VQIDRRSLNLDRFNQKGAILGRKEQSDHVTTKEYVDGGKKGPYSHTNVPPNRKSLGTNVGINRSETLSEGVLNTEKNQKHSSESYVAREVATNLSYKDPWKPNPPGTFSIKKRVAQNLLRKKEAAF